MLNLQKLIKPWSEAASLNAHINLYGYWSENTFLTKSGDLGMVLSVAGVDYESLDNAEQQYAVKRLESAWKSFGEGFHVYQYLFKTNRPDIPFAHYGDELIDAAIEQRREFFESKRDRLYQIEIFYVVILEGPHSRPGFFRSLGRLVSDPRTGYADLQAQFSSDGMKTLVRTQLDTVRVKLEQRVEQFVRQTADLTPVSVLGKDEQFTFFRRLVNFDSWRIAGRPQASQYLDYQIVNSDIEAERDHLRVGNHFVRTLTMKEAIVETRPLVLDQLLKIEANFYVVTEWTPLTMGKARREVDKRRKHFNMAKSGFISQMRDPTQTSARDQLIDESKQADVENLGDCMRALGEGQLLGDFSLTVVLYAPELATIERSIGEFAGIFTNRDGELFAETYNQLNAFFAVVPGNWAHNLRKLYLLLSNYADLSFLFTIHPGERTNPQLASEYLAVLETDNATPYFLNLHNGEVAHTLILGMTGSGKTTLLNALADYIPDHERIVVIEDTAELRIGKPNLLASECQTESHAAAVNFNDLLKAALRWRPDRIILGEVRGDEARTLLDSFNTGHAGSMATIHASTAVKALRRFGELAMRSHQQSNRDDIAAEIAESVQVVIQVSRYPEGRAIAEVITVQGYDRSSKTYQTESVYSHTH